ncbi:MAG: excinuclease ABC subunit UvrB [Chloroflexota bacterium]|nr:excinuclease ABC subunit UvrB [Chloroflexota bacterium]
MTTVSAPVRNSRPFELSADYQPTGDQPYAIDRLVEGLDAGHRAQTLLGVTGSGKTFTMANVVAQLNRPTLVLAHNKTLAAQLCTEFRDFFPNNAVEYFVSYYDYYQPEAYIPRSDTYIAKESDINDEIDKLRHAATRALFERRDVLIVASVSCIYGLGEPEDYQGMVLSLEQGKSYSRNLILRRLVDQQYERDELTLSRGKFRIRGDTLTIHPSYEDLAVRVQFWDDEVERIVELDPLTGEILAERDRVDIYPAKHFVTTDERMAAAVEDIQAELAQRLEELRREDRILEAARLEERTRYDLETLRETGYCPGIENYSRHLARRAAGSTPWTLLDYFPEDWLLFIDESHMTIPQVRGMYGGDTSRKQTLVDFGFRLPSAIDNRPLNIDEFERHINQVVFVSATPADYERNHSAEIVEQLIRPTGLLDPDVEVRGTDGQIDDLVSEIKTRAERGERTLVTTLTKKMAEDLADYLREVGIRTYYLHSEQDAFQRVEVLRDLRLGVFDCLVGINLLREGLDLPEVSLVAVLDADKEGFLRNEGSMVQTIGRAARHVNSHAILYADRITDSMRRAMDETHRRREAQREFNEANNITPVGITKEIRDIAADVANQVRDEFEQKMVAEDGPEYDSGLGATIPEDMSPDQIARMISELESRMKQAARDLEFEKAAALRDQIVELRRDQAALGEDLQQWSDQAYGRRRRPLRRKEPVSRQR